MGVVPYTAYYENSRGEVLRLDEAPWILIGGDVFDAKWQLVTAPRAIGEGERLLRGRRPCDERTLEIAVVAQSAGELAERLEQMSDILEYDLHRAKAGRLWISGRYLSCWCRASAKELSCDFPMMARLTLKVYPQMPVWCAERKYRFSPNSGEESGHRYPYRYPYRYGTGRRSLTLVNRSTAPAPMRIVFYGPVINPRVLVGAIDIGIDVTLESGEYAVVDQLTREVYSVSRSGVRSNCFDSRRKTGMTFESAPPGSSTVQLVSGEMMDITLIEQRSEPRWSCD